MQARMTRILMTGLAIGTILGGMVTFVFTSKKTPEVTIKSTQDSSESVENMLKQVEKANQEEIEDAYELKDEQLVLEQAEKYIETMYTYKNVKERQEALQGFMLNQDVADKLLAYEGVGDNTIDINSEVIKQNNFIKKIDDLNYAVFTRATIRYNKKKASTDYITNITHFKKGEAGNWLVLDTLTMSDDMTDRFMY